MIGQTVSHYRIIETLGSGGMGVVSTGGLAGDWIPRAAIPALTNYSAGSTWNLKLRQEHAP